MAQVDPLSIAMSGLANINRGLAVVSQNIANANTPGYVHESLQQQAMGAGDMPMGVTTGIATRDIDIALQSRIAMQNAGTGEASVRADALSQIDAMQGKPGAGTDLVALLGNVSTAFSTLLTDPAVTAQQQAVVDQASALAGHLRDASAQIATLRQTAHDRVVSDIGGLNADLATIGNLNRQIISARALGAGTADLENQRDAAAMHASSYLALSFVPRSNGDMTVFTTSGLELPTNGTSSLSVAGASLGPTSYYPGGGVPGVMLNGVDVTQSMRSGTIGGAIDLRDTALPTDHAMLDEFAVTIQTRFSDQGLGLFSDPAGTFYAASATPPRQGPYVGYAGQIVVHPAVVANPSLVRDGTGAVAARPGGPLPFTPNPAGGPSGFTTLITNVLTYALGGNIAPGAAHPRPNLTQMGPSGTLSSPAVAAPDLTSFATRIVTQQAGDAAGAAATLTAAQDTQTVLQQNAALRSGVSMDAELSHMITLQNAYSANARVITTMQSLWSQLLQTVQ